MSRALDPGQALVGGHNLRGVHLLGTDGGADDVDPVQGRLGADVVLVVGEGELVVGDVQDVVLDHLVPADDLADPDPDLPGTAQTPRVHGGDDLGQLDVGGFQQCQAFTGPLGSQGGVAARDQAFGGVVRVGDLGQVGLVEQAASKIAVSEAALGDLCGLDGVEADGVAETVGVAGDAS